MNYSSLSLEIRIFFVVISKGGGFSRIPGSHSVSPVLVSSPDPPEKRIACAGVVRAGGCPVVTAQWWSTGGSSQGPWVQFLSTASFSLFSTLAKHFNELQFTRHNRSLTS